MFQSRNRETYDSNKRVDHTLAIASKAFQSRNRETYDSNLIVMLTFASGSSNVSIS